MLVPVIQTNNKNTKIIEFTNVPTDLLLYTSKRGQTFLIGVSIWLMLKNETTSGKIKSYHNQLHALASKYQTTVRSFSKYIPWLLANNLLRLEDKDLILTGYKALKSLNINVDNRETISYNINGPLSLAEIIIERAKSIESQG